MRIEAPTREQVAYVARNMRKADEKEFLALSFAEDRYELIEMLTKLYGNSTIAIGAADDAGPIAVGAMVEARPNVSTLMFFATERFPHIALPLTRFIRQRLFPLYRGRGTHRIECVSIDGYDAAHRWIEILGLKREAVLRGFGKRGEAFHQFAWTADDVC